MTSSRARFSPRARPPRRSANNTGRRDVRVKGRRAHSTARPSIVPPSTLSPAVVPAGVDASSRRPAAAGRGAAEGEERRLIRARPAGVEGGERRADSDAENGRAARPRRRHAPLRPSHTRRPHVSGAVLSADKAGARCHATRRVEVVLVVSFAPAYGATRDGRVPAPITSQGLTTASRCSLRPATVHSSPSTGAPSARSRPRRPAEVVQRSVRKGRT